MLADALEVATDPDYKFDLAVQLGRLEVAKVNLFSTLPIPSSLFLESVEDKVALLPWNCTTLRSQA